MNIVAKGLAGIFYVLTISAAIFFVWEGFAELIYKGTGVELRVFLSMEKAAGIAVSFFFIGLVALILYLMFSDEG